MRARLLCLLACLIGTDLSAGAWPREKGGVFLSLSYELTTSRAFLAPEALAYDPSPELYHYASVYGEYGLTDSLTLGLDTGREERPETWAGVVFLRVPVGPTEGRHRFAAQLGLGLRFYEQPGLYYGLETTEREWILRPAFSWGYGFDGRLGTGWLGVESSLELREETDGMPVKLDATAGLNVSERSSLLLQLQTGDYPGSPAYAKILPGLVTRTTEKISLESSLIYSFYGSDRLGAKAAIWLEF